MPGKVERINGIAGLVARINGIDGFVARVDGISGRVEIISPAVTVGEFLLNDDGYPLNPFTFGQLLSGFNAADAMWLGDEAVGATDLSGGGIDLVDQNAPTHLVFDQLLGADTVDFTLATTDRMEAPNLGDIQIGAGESFLLVWVGNPYAQDTTRSLAGQRDSSGLFPGWELIMAGSGDIAGQMQGFINDTAGNADAVVVSDNHVGLGSVVALLRDFSTGDLTLFTQLGTSLPLAMTAVGALTTSFKFAFGQARSNLRSVGNRFALGGLWRGANAEGFGQSNFDALVAALPLAPPPELTVAFDFSAPTAQPFPTTAAVMNTLTGATPKHIWTFDDPDAQIDKLNSIALNRANQPLRQQKAPGIWDGTSYVQTCVEASNKLNNSFFTSAVSTEIEAPIGTALAFLLVFRQAKPIGGTLETWGSTGAGVRIDTTPNSMRVRHQGLVADVPGVFNDGAVHCVIGGKRADGELRIFTDLGSATNPIADANSTGNFIRLFAGGQNAHFQAIYGATFLGADAQTILTQAAFDGFWQHGKDPTGELSVNIRSTLISDIVGTDADGDLVAHFSGEPAIPQIPIVYRPGFTDANKFGLLVEAAHTNEVTESEDLSDASWAPINATVTKNDDNAPDGFQSASLVTNTAADAGVRANVTGLAAGGTYTLSVWARPQAGHADGKVRLRLASKPSGTPTVETEFTLTVDDWTRINESIVLGAGETECEITLLTSAAAASENAFFWGVQLQVSHPSGQYATAYVRSIGAPATTARTIYLKAGNVPFRQAGKYDATLIRNTSSPDFQGFITRFVADSNPLSSLRRLTFDVFNRPQWQVRNLNSLEFGIIDTLNTSTPGTEHKIAGQWDSLAGVGGREGKLDFDGTITDADPFPWEDSAGTGFGQSIAIGQGSNGQNQLEGVIQRLRVFSVAEPPDVVPEILNYPTTAAELVSAMGITSSPVSMWRTKGSGSIADLVGGNTLSRSGTPVATFNGTLGEVTRFDQNTTDALDAASAAILTPSTESFACLWIGRILSNPPSDQQIVGNREFTAPNPGWDVIVDAIGRILFVIDIGATEVGQLVSAGAAGKHLIILAVRDVAANNLQLFIGGDFTGQSAGVSNLVGDISNANPFSIGDNDRLRAAGMESAFCAFWQGVGAEDGFNATHVAALKASIGL